MRAKPSARFFHGTSLTLLPTIMRSGYLLPEASNRQCVYITTSIRIAEYESGKASQPIILEVYPPPRASLHPDPEYGRNGAEFAVSCPVKVMRMMQIVVT